MRSAVPHPTPEGASIDNQIVAVAKDVSDLATTKLTAISAVARATRMLAMNARIEANRFGDQGAAFTVVADEVAGVSRSVIRAMSTRSGQDFVAGARPEPLLGGAVTTFYATAVREGGDAAGPIIGALGIHFGWEPQARAVVDGVRLSEAE